MKNKQPFYHRVERLLFTSTSEVSEREFIDVLSRSKELKKLGILLKTIQIEPNTWIEPEPGDPCDL